MGTGWSAGDGPRAHRGDMCLSEDSQEGREPGKWVLFLSLATPPVHPSLRVSTKMSGEFLKFWILLVHSGSSGILAEFIKIAFWRKKQCGEMNYKVPLQIKEKGPRKLRSIPNHMKTLRKSH